MKSKLQNFNVILKFGFAVIFVISFSGCNPFFFLKPEKRSNPEPAPIKSKSSCDRMLDAVYADQNIETATSKNIEVQRKYQRVIRKDCLGNITSDKVETVGYPIFILNIDQIQNNKSKAVLVYNQPSCDHKLTNTPVADTFFTPLGGINGDGKGNLRITGDLDSAATTFKFSAGENKLYIRFFYDCSPKDFEGNVRTYSHIGTCEVSKDFKTILYPITITYSEINLPEPKLVDPLSCK